MKKSAILILILGVLLIPVQLNRAAYSQPQRPDADQITAFLNEHPLLTDSRAKVLSVTIFGEALVIDLSSEIWVNGVFDETPLTQLEHDLELAFNISQFFMLTFKVEGKTLESWGRPIPVLTS